ncbi:hypothetical protein Y032_0010g882 [Ancylostoma ceylanicum]|nr:hypothetical protein Y032_0010g882 [Ancylostoma ceylanicum]
MRTIPIIFLFVIYVSGLVSGGTTNEKNSRNRWMQKRSAGSSEIINYYFDYKMEQTKKDLFRKAAKAWEDYTCVEFKEDNKRASNPMFVRGDYDCSFNKSPGEGTGHILSVGCGYFGGAAHEVGHALGLIHTHTRYDRETYLTVNSTNVEREFRESYEDDIKDLKETQIKKQAEDYKRVQYGKSEIESDYYGVPYDYGSIMHYGTADVNPSMIPTDKNHKRTMGSQFISFTDLLEVNKRYNCLGKCPDDDDRTVTCEHDGFPNPKNCSACVCPRGYGGPSCGKMPDDCGQDLRAQDDWQPMVLNISSPRNSSEYFVCTSWIRSEHGKTIEVEIDSITDDLKTYGCGYAAVEIKSQDDQRLTGYRFCSKDDQGIRLTSNHTPVPIITYSMTTAPLHVTLKYRSGKSIQMFRFFTLHRNCQYSVKNHSNYILFSSDQRLTLV